MVEAARRTLPASVVDVLGHLPGQAAKAAHWHESCGRLRRAAALLKTSETPYAARLRELVAALEAGELPLPLSSGEARVATQGRVVMAFHASEPWVVNGYTARSRSLLTAAARAGAECCAVTRPGFPWDLRAHRTVPLCEDEEVDGIRYRRLRGQDALWKGPLGRYIEAFADGLAALARAEGAGVIHAASNHVVGLAGCLAAERVGARAIYEMRGLWHWSTSTRRPGWQATEVFALHEALERQAALRADQVVVLSQAMADYVQAWGVAVDRIAVVPNGIDVGLFRPLLRDPNVRARWGLSEKTFVVGYVGTLTPYEGLDTLLRAVARLRGTGVDVRAVLIGSGEDEERLKALSRKMGAEALFPGRVPAAAVPETLAAMDCCPFPRIDSPVTRLVPPLKLPEAMACGVPVVVSDLPALTEIVDHERTGLVFGRGVEALAESLYRLQADPAMASALSREGANWAASQRSWREVVQPLLDLWGASGLSAGGAG